MISKPTAVYILCGLPFSGKTTLARALAQQCGFIHLDVDALARQSGEQPGEGISDERWGQIFREAHLQLTNLLFAGHSIIFDAVNYRRIGRDRLRSIAEQAGGSAYVILVATPLAEVARRRTENFPTQQRPTGRQADFDRLLRDFEAPTLEESIITFDGSQTLDEWIARHFPVAI
jgi:predicted kinase